MLPLVGYAPGIVGNAQRATARARCGMRPSVPLVLSPGLSNHGARRAEALWIARP